MKSTTHNDKSQHMGDMNDTLVLLCRIFIKNRLKIFEFFFIDPLTCYIIISKNINFLDQNTPHISYHWLLHELCICARDIHFLLQVVPVTYNQMVVIMCDRYLSSCLSPAIDTCYTYFEFCLQSRF